MKLIINDKREQYSGGNRQIVERRDAPLLANRVTESEVLAMRY